MDDAARKKRFEALVAEAERLRAQAEVLSARLQHVAPEEGPSRPSGIGWLFRLNASRREKAFTLFLLGWIALSIYGMTNSFVAEPWVKEAAAYAAVPLCLLFFVPVLLDRHPSNRMWMSAPLKRFSLYLVLLAFAYALSWAGLALGSASLATRFFGEELAGEFRVVWRSDGTWRRRECDFALQVQEMRSRWTTKTCVDEEFWATVKTGDVLQGRGRRSTLGAMLLELSRQGPAGPAARW